MRGVGWGLLDDSLKPLSTRGEMDLKLLLNTCCHSPERLRDFLVTQSSSVHILGMRVLASEFLVQGSVRRGKEREPVVIGFR